MTWTIGCNFFYFFVSFCSLLRLGYLFALICGRYFEGESIGYHRQVLKSLVTGPGSLPLGFGIGLPLPGSPGAWVPPVEAAKVRRLEGIGGSSHVDLTGHRCGVGDLGDLYRGFMGIWYILMSLMQIETILNPSFWYCQLDPTRILHPMASWSCRQGCPKAAFGSGETGSRSQGPA